MLGNPVVLPQSALLHYILQALANNKKNPPEES